MIIIRIHLSPSLYCTLLWCSWNVFVYHFFIYCYVSVHDCSLYINDEPNLPPSVCHSLSFEVFMDIACLAEDKREETTHMELSPGVMLSQVASMTPFRY